MKKGKSYADMVKKNRGSMKITANQSDKIIPLDENLSPMTLNSNQDEFLDKHFKMF